MISENTMIFVRILDRFRLINGHPFRLSLKPHSVLYTILTKNGSNFFEARGKLKIASLIAQV